MSDVSTFIRRGQNGQESINKLQALITPLAFPDPEEAANKERIILSNPVRKRINTVLAGLDITDSTTASRDRVSTAITLLADTETPITFPVTPTLTGTLDLLTNKKFGAGATFNGSQYISIPDDNQLDLTLPFFTMAFWFKNDGVNQGNQTIWDKGNFVSNEDYCSACTDYDSGDYSTTPESALDAGLQVKIQGNLTADYESASSDFDASYDTSTTSERIKVIISDGTNSVEDTLDISGIYDTNFHSVVIVSQDSIPDYCSACTDYDSGDYIQVSSPVLTIYVDKVSIGTIDHSSVSGDLSNSQDAIIGAEDTSLTDPLVGTLALFEYQATNWTTTDIDSYHDDARIRVTSQKAAFHFTGNDSGETGLKAILG